MLCELPGGALPSSMETFVPGYSSYLLKSSNVHGPSGLRKLHQLTSIQMYKKKIDGERAGVYYKGSYARCISYGGGRVEKIVPYRHVPYK